MTVTARHPRQAPHVDPAAVADELARLVEAGCPGGDHTGRCEYRVAADIVRDRLPALLSEDMGETNEYAP